MDSLLRKKKKGLPIQLFFYLKVKPLTLDPLPGPPRPCLHLEVPAGLSWVWGLLMSPGQRYLILQVPKWMSQEKKKKNQEPKKKDNRGSNTQLKATSATFHEADSWSKAKTDPSEFILSPLCQALYMQSSQPEQLLLIPVLLRRKVRSEGLSSLPEITASQQRGLDSIHRISQVPPSLCLWLWRRKGTH